MQWSFYISVWVILNRWARVFAAVLVLLTGAAPADVSAGWLRACRALAFNKLHLYSIRSLRLRLPASVNTGGGWGDGGSAGLESLLLSTKTLHAKVCLWRVAHVARMVGPPHPHPLHQNTHAACKGMHTVYI